MTRFFIALYDKLSSRKWLAWSILGILILSCTGLAIRLNYQEDISAFLPLDEQAAKYSAVYNNLDGQGKVVVVFQTGKEGEKGIEEIQEAIDSFCEILTETDTIDCIRDLQARHDESRIMDMLGFIWQNYPYMLSDADFVRIDSMMANSAFIKRQMEYNRQMIMLPTSGLMTQSVCHDPLHLSAPITSALQQTNVGDAFQVINGYIFTKECDKGIVSFESPYGISESRRNAMMADILDQAINVYHRQNPDSKIEISAVGAPLIAVTNAKQIKQDSFIAVALAVVLIFIVLYTSFRRFSDIFWIGISISVGWLFAIGCISLLKDGISMIVIGIGSVIIGIAVNYPLHFIDHLKHEKNKRNALKDMVQPLLIGNITTVSAFLCLVLLDAEAMRDLGIFSSLMLIGTILFVLILLPVLVPSRCSGTPTGIVPGHFSLPKLSTKLARTIPWAVAVITFILFFFSINTSFDSNIQNINYMTSSQRANLQLLTSSMEQTDSARLLYVVAEGETMEEALRNNEDLLRSLDTLPGIRQISGIGRLIPSKRKQEENAQRWNKLWDSHPEMKRQFGRACEETGFAEASFSPFVRMTSEKLGIQEADYFSEAMPLFAENFIMKGNGIIKIVNFVSIDKQVYDRLKQHIRDRLPQEAYAFDATDMGNHLVTVLSDSFNYIGFVCGFVVFFFLWLSFGRLELSLLSFLPLAVSWIWILGIMDICSIQFNIVNIILATFIFGQGDDYTIFITEGLMYEYAYGKKTIQAYKNSVAVSGIIMFIGIGTLIVARHPAMRSLAEVAIVGMVTVVLMAFYLPPLVFRWLTILNGEVREYPLTIKRIVYSLYSFMAFLLGLVFSMPVIFVYTLFVKKQEKVSLFIHKILEKFSKFVIYRVPGTSFKIVNPHGETFQRPALIICNHQSQLDLMAVMSVYPKITILTKDWVWNNPFYGRIIRASEFYPVTNGVDSYLLGMKNMVKRGYSIVVFPEGTRSANGILRFHKGAFLLAQQLELDILPFYLHGFNDVLPRHDFMLREGSMTMEIGERMPAQQVMAMDCMMLRKFFHTQYVRRFAEMRRKYETSAYFIPFVRYKYMYKGSEIERRSRKLLSERDAISKIVDRDFSSVESYTFEESGQGEIPFIFAKAHPNMQVYAEFTDEDNYLVASNLQGIPDNLHFSLTPNTDCL